MSQIADNFLQRVRQRTFDKFGMDRMPEWIHANTFKFGEPYSFDGYEYQAAIASDTSRIVVVRKCSQIGATEVFSRMTLALMGVNDAYTVIYTMPTSSMGTTFMKTRIDPIIAGSPALKDMVSKELNNSETKQFGANNFLHVKGCQSNNAPISIPADHLIHDEIDFSDADVISQYQSRLTHSMFKRNTLLSTPTIPKYGIDNHFSKARRHFSMCKCNHCAHWFLPSYFEHVKIPKFDGDLREINARNIHNYDWRGALLLCPRCGKAPDLTIKHRQYVIENQDENFEAAGYQISPFDAPLIHLRGDDPMCTAAFLVNQSTKYSRYIDFVNYNLGLPAEDKETALSEQELYDLIARIDMPGLGSIVMGIDFGKTTYFTVAKVFPDESLLVLETTTAALHQIQETRRQLALRYRPRVTVADSLPYTETVLQMQQEDPNLFAAIYEDRASLELHRLRQKEENDDKGQSDLREILINRNKTLDALMSDIRRGAIHKRSDANDDEWVKQMTDMKRAASYDKRGNMAYIWQKSPEGNDHFHHSLLYTYVAAKMIGIGGHNTSVLTLMGRFNTSKPKRRR